MSFKENKKLITIGCLRLLQIYMKTNDQHVYTLCNFFFQTA